MSTKTESSNGHAQNGMTNGFLSPNHQSPSRRSPVESIPEEDDDDDDVSLHSPRDDASDGRSDITVTSACNGDGLSLDGRTESDSSRPESEKGSNGCLVGNLIDLASDSNSSGSEKPPIRPRSSAEGMTAVSEQSFEGVANGFMNGTNSSLLDSPLEPMRPSTSGPSPVHSPQNSLSSPSSGGAFVPGHRKYPSASTAGNMLYQQGHRGNSNYSGGSRRSSFNSDVENMSGVSDAELHSEITDISSQVQKIQKQLAMMEEHHLTSDDKHVRLKSDNAVLQERLHTLEEQLQATEERWKDKYRDEKQKSKEIQARIEREKALELESVLLKHQILETEHRQCIQVRKNMESEFDKLRSEHARYKEQSEDLSIRVQHLEEEKETLERELERTKGITEEQKTRNAEILAELSRQNEELQGSGRPRQQSLVDTASELHEELQFLREEKRELEEKNGELQAELLQAHVNQGMSLLNASDGPSLALEMDGKDKNELVNALKEQEVCNQKLRNYIDGILTRVIEKYPEILEISAASSN